MELAELLARIEGADGPDRELDFDLERLALEGDGWEREDCGPRYSPKWIRAEGDGRYFVHGIAPPLTGSVDAALALVERVLPGAVYLLDNQDGLHFCSLQVDGVTSNACLVNSTAPLAILSALLKALIAKASPQ